jgi:CheY-like chemotaxis protein
LLFSVTDTGIGLSLKQRQRLFSAFTQADTSITRRYGGTGLGLALCKKLTALMGGDIWCESELGEGSTFFFTVRLGIADAGLPVDDHPGSFEELNVLIVETETAFVSGIYDLLYSLGCRMLDKASSIDSALEKATTADAERPLDLIVFGQGQMDAQKFYPQSPYADADRRIHSPAFILIEDIEHPVPVFPGITTNAITAPLNPSKLYDAILISFNSVVQLNPHARERQKELDLMKPFAGNRILLVEDNEINQLVANEVLIQAGLLVDIAGNGAIALEALERCEYDLILMDIQMPEMDGLTATRRIRERKELGWLPIIAFTAHAMDEDRQKSMEAGMNAHVTKPIDNEQLFSALAEWLEKGHRAREMSVSLDDLMLS